MGIQEDFFQAVLDAYDYYCGISSSDMICSVGWEQFENDIKDIVQDGGFVMLVLLWTMSSSRVLSPMRGGVQLFAS